MMKRYMWVVPVVALVVLGSFAVSRHVSFAKGQAGEPATSLNGEVRPLDVTIPLRLGT
jgi:hypothetical protein